MAKKVKPVPPGSPLETRIERFRSASNEIWTRQDNFPLGEFLAPGFDILESYLGEFVQQFEGNEARIKRLEELLAAAEALLKKLEGIDLDSLDPDQIRQQVLEALAEWRAQIDAALKELTQRTTDLAATDAQHNNRISAAEAALQALQEADRGLDKALADLSKKTDEIGESDTRQNNRLSAAEAALQALQQTDSDLSKSLAELLKQLATLQESDGKQNTDLQDLKNSLSNALKSIADLSKSDESQNQKLTQVENDLLALSKKVNDLVLGSIDPEKIKQAVLDALAQWRSEVGKALLKLQSDSADMLSRVAAAEQAIEALRKTVEGLDLTGLDPEKIRQQVLDALSTWQQKLEAALHALDVRVKELGLAIESTNKALKDQGERIATAETTLTGHKSALDQLRTDLSALAAEVARIITNGGPDPEAIKKLVLEALRGWQERIQADLANLATRATDLEQTAGRHSDTLSTHTRQIEELQKQLDEIISGPIKPEEIIRQVLDLLADWRKQIEQRIGEAEAAQRADRQRIDGHDGKIADLFKSIEQILSSIADLQGEDRRLADALKDLKTDLETRIKETLEGLLELDRKLLTEIARLDGRINTIETTGVDPEQVRQIIREEFKIWQEGIESRLRTVETVTKGLRFGYDALIRRLVKLETNTLSTEEVRSIISRELALWREQTDKSIADLWAKIRSDAEALAKWQVAFDLRLDGDEAALSDLQKKLADLDRLLHERTDQLPTATEIRDAVLALLLEWRGQVDKGLGDHNQTLRLLEAEIKQLADDIKALARSIPDPEALKNAIIALLGEWQKKTEHDIDLLDRRSSKSKEDIEDLRDSLNALVQRVNELVLTGGTPADVEKRIREALDSLRRQLEKELAAVRDRNEQDRLALLQLRGTLDIVQERVRKLEIRNVVTEVLAALEERLKAVEALAQNAHAIAAAQQARLDDLLKTDGTLEQMQQALELLKRQMARRPDTERVQQMIDTALDGLAQWRQLTDGSIKRLELGLTKTNSDLNDLREESRKAARLAHKELEQKTGELDERIRQLDQATDARLDAAEKRLDEDDTQDRIFKEEATNRFVTLEGWKTGADKKFEKALDKDAEHDRRLKELQEQIDNWKPDASGDMADRLARRCLTGRGIVMGFEVWHTQQYTLHIGPGLGITSEGHVIRFREGEYFTHYREWKERAEYKIFQSKEGKAVAAWELVPKSADETGCTPLTPQRGSHLHTPFIEGKVVLAFIPPEGTPPGEESKITFVLVDQQDMARLLGAKRLLELLVADHEDTDVTWEEDYSPLDEIPTEEDFCLALRPELGLMEIPLPRFGFNPRDKCSTPDLDCTDFPKIVSFDDLYKASHPSVQDALMRLDVQIRQIIRWYGRLLFPQFSTDYFEERLEKMLDKWTDYAEYCEDYNEKKSQPAKFPNLPPKQPQWFVQYYYDWARDLIAAYHELRDELNALMAASCLAEQDEPKAQHPRHLMLGLALREEHTGLASPLRHEFVQPPIYNSNNARLEACRLYFRRWFFMVQGFYLPIDKDPVANPTCHRDDDGNFPNPLSYNALKITPGRSYFHPLSAQSLPFYYLVTLGTQSVHRYWNYRRAKTGTANQLLCYHASDAADSYSKLAHVIRPLYYTFDAYDFYRVEGHIGMPLSAIADLQHMVRKYNLDFRIISRPLEALGTQIEAEMEKCLSLHTFKDKLLGAEHLAGVPKGGTLILVTDEGKIVADFSVPYRCCSIPMTILTKVGTCQDQAGKAPVEVSLTVMPDDPPSTSFIITLDGETMKGAFKYLKEATIKVPGDGSQHKIRIQDSIDTTYFAETTVTTPRCGFTSPN